MDLGLIGKRAIVTGATRGIGFAIASALVDEGVEVAICGRTDGAVEAGVKALKEKGGTRCMGAAVDVRDSERYCAWIASVADALGGLDIFVANASAMVEGNEDAAWRSAFETDLLHCVRGCQAAVTYLRRAGAGAIVVVASTAAVAPFGVETRAYGAIKAALVNLGSQLAHDLAGDGIRVNTVSPGSIDFPGGFWDVCRTKNPETYKAMRATHALGRYGRPDEVAAAVVFLASPAASFITGVNLRIDGGQVKAIDF